MASHSTLVTGACCVLLSIALPSLASAQSVDEQLAALSASDRKKFTDALVLSKKLYEQGEYEVALRQMERAYAILPLPELMYRRGAALEKLGRDAEAIEAFSIYLETSTDTSSARRAEVERALERLRARVEDANRAFVQVITEPEGATIFVADEERARALTPHKLEVSAEGSTSIRLTKPGYISQEHELDGSAGETLILSVKLSPEVSEQAAAPADQSTSPVVLGLGAGAGVLALASTGFFGLYALNESKVDALSDRSAPRPTDYNTLIYAQNRRARRGWFSLGGALLLGASALTLHHIGKPDSSAGVSVRANGVQVTF